MLDYWKENGPPIHVSAAIYLGLTGKKKTKAPKLSEVDANENERNLMSLAAGLAGSGGVFHG